jgi:hypothetical protein
MEKKVEFNELFYTKVMTIFAENLGQELNINPDDPSIDYLKAQEFNNSLEYSRSLILQIVIKCAQEHTFRFRIFAVNNELIEKISKLNRYKSKLLNLWIVKFFKAILRGKDEIFYQYLTKKNLFKTIVDIFIENPNKTNLIHSSILELFDYLTKEYNKKIASHLVSNTSI